MTPLHDTIDEQAAREQAEEWMAPAHRGEPAHHMHGTYTCTRCGETFDTFDALKAHQPNCTEPAAPPPKPPRSYPCRYCDRTFKQPGGRGRHEKRFHYEQWKRAKADAIPDRERPAARPDPTPGMRPADDAEAPDDANARGPLGAVLAELRRGQQILQGQLDALRSAELALTRRAEES